MQRTGLSHLLACTVGGWLFLAGCSLAGEPGSGGGGLWQLATKKTNSHRFSTLFTAQDVRDRLSSDEGLSRALAWCKETGVTKVYIESFRDGYQAERTALEKARDTFRSAGFLVSGCITPTKVGKPSTRWKEAISCYTDMPTQDKLQSIFEYAAGLFDEIMIDDFWFTDCACSECDAARKSRIVTIGSHQYPVAGDTWEDYRCELMVRLSRERLLVPARRINHKVKLIIKYPQWYDQFHERGYEVLRETADFDKIWVGTETRDYGNLRWGGTVQYEAYFIMRWLGGMGGSKCGGGWFDPFGTTERTYVEQARQTVLGGARESMLFCYGALQRDTGPRNVEALRAEIPELLSVAKEIRKRQIIGVAAYKPANSHPETEPRVFDFVGMLGLPLVPCYQFPAKAAAGFFSMHALKDPDIEVQLGKFVKSGKPTILTTGLARALAHRLDFDRPNVHILEVKQNPKSLLELAQGDLDVLRAGMLRPFDTTFRAPNQVSLYLFKDKSWVIENFNSQPAQVELNGKDLIVPARGWVYQWN
ncbi:MAG TPA: hypothetical protein VJA21_27405 [Verrucomicrobiae bacterium]